MPSTAEILNSSLQVVVEREPFITPFFYETLFSRYPQLQPLFGRNSREVQARMLQDSIVALVEHVEDPEWLSVNVRALGVRHAGYGVTDEMYDQVGECLLHTLAHYAGDAWTPEVAQAWTDTYVAVAGIMKQAAAESKAEA